MSITLLKFKKLGNHWYIDLPHDNPSDLVLDKKIERILNRLDKYKEGSLDIYLSEQSVLSVNLDGLIQFNDSDLLRYFTTDDSFTMDLYISNHKFSISSSLYFLLEQKYHFDFHELIYKVVIY